MVDQGGIFESSPSLTDAFCQCFAGNSFPGAMAMTNKFNANLGMPVCEDVQIGLVIAKARNSSSANCPIEGFLFWRLTSANFIIVQKTVVNCPLSLSSLDWTGRGMRAMAPSAHLQNSPPTSHAYVRTYYASVVEHVESTGDPSATNGLAPSGIEAVSGATRIRAGSWQHHGDGC